MSGNLTDRLILEAKALGFNQVGINPAKPARRLEAYFQWIKNGYHGEMSYLARPDRALRRRDLGEILPGVRSIISVAFDYRTAVLPEGVTNDPARGRISNYAWGIDYHKSMTERLAILAERLADWRGSRIRSKVYVDTGAILERDHGETAGLGFTGKNTMLIAPRRGSYFFLGQLLTTAELEPVLPPKAMPSCGTCHSCMDYCPTKAFPEPYVLDARRCISYLTIELKDWIHRDLRPLMGNWIYGCDICQEVCPFNRFSIKRGAPGFYPGDLDSAAPPLLDILQLSDVDFSRQYANSPIKRIKRRGLIRNACVAAGNWGDYSAVPVLISLLNDPEPIIRGHAAWALGQIGGKMALGGLDSALEAEIDNLVRQEIQRALNQP
ncbi:MAG: tRNA epoxyqueuosine(34) reductase QueG [Anaerolineae bacterium]|nr:MAG: tRNA epoxyqueuosine(34) reductase QueG [Anaerolineae bacterium]